MRWVLTSDLHINDWSEFSSFDETTGVPSRLKDYLYLAEDIVKLGKRSGCSSVIVAGDISHKSVQRPSVLNVIKEFFQILSSSFNVYCIVGQHDFDTKSVDILNNYNCIVNPLLEIEKVKLFVTSGVDEVDGIRVLFKSWNPEFWIFKETDLLEGVSVFVGHGLVRGAHDSFGSVFKSGFDPDFLLNNFELSVVGDIHKRQVIDRDGRKLVIPGSPIQHSWKDDPDCGLYIYDTSNKELTFFSTDDLRPNYYHKFIFSDEIKGDHRIHVRKSLSTRTTRSRKSPISLDQTTDYQNYFSYIFDVIQKVISSLIVDDSERDFCLSKVQSITSSFSSKSSKVFGKYELVSIEVKNFLSIKHLELDFSDLNGIVCVIGMNGSGKTTLFEAIFYAITGSISKDLKVSQIKSDFSDDEEYFVTINLSDGLSISRGRRNGSPFLKLFHNGIDVSGSSISDTQSKIDDLLGPKDILFSLCYFPAVSPTLFCDFTQSKKYDLISKVFDLSVIDEIRDLLNTDLKSLSEKLSELRGEISRIERTKFSLERRVTDLVDKDDLDVTSVRSEIEKIDRELSLLSIGEDDEKIFLEKSKELSVIQLQKSKIDSEISRLWKITEEAKKGKCSLCGQPLPANSVLRKKSLEDIQKLSQEMSELEEKEVEIRSLVDDLKDKITKKNQLLDRRKKLSDTLEIAKRTVDVPLDMLDDLNKDLLILQSKKSSLEKERDLLEKLQKLFSKKSGAIVTNISKYISNCINEKINSFGLNSISVKFNEDMTVQADFGDKKWRSFESLSNGQSRVVNIIMMVALHNIYCDLHNLKNGILGLSVFDEVVSFVDENLKEEVRSVLSQMSTKKLFLISQDPQVSSFGEKTIRVRMTSEGSSYILS